MKINKDNMLITIDSELGSQGAQVGAELSKMLDIPCYAEEILDKAAEVSGIAPKLMHRYDGRTVRAAYDLTAEDESAIKLRPAQDFITAQVVASKALASKGACILVDRHANAALEGNPAHVSIFIHADFDTRAAAYAEENGLDLESAKKALKKADSAYRSHYKGNNKNWGSADSYDLTVNAAGTNAHALAGTIVGFLESMSGETLVQHTTAQAM